MLPHLLPIGYNFKPSMLPLAALLRPDARERYTISVSVSHQCPTVREPRAVRGGALSAIGSNLHIQLYSSARAVALPTHHDSPTLPNAQSRGLLAPVLCHIRHCTGGEWWVPGSCHALVRSHHCPPAEDASIPSMHLAITCAMAHDVDAYE